MHHHTSTGASRHIHVIGVLPLSSKLSHQPGLPRHSCPFHRQLYWLVLSQAGRMMRSSKPFRPATVTSWRASVKRQLAVNHILVYHAGLLELQGHVIHCGISNWAFFDPKLGLDHYYACAPGYVWFVIRLAYELFPGRPFLLRFHSCCSPGPTSPLKADFTTNLPLECCNLLSLQ